MLKREKVYQILLERIRSGIWEPGFKIPSEPVLSRELGVARITLRAALEQLAEESILSRSRPGGTVVSLPESEKKKIIVISRSDMIPEISRPELYIIPGIAKRCLELNCEVEYMSDSFLLERLPENYIGIIFLSGDFNGDEELLKKVQRANVPVVNAHVFPGDPAITKLPSIRTDFRAAFLAGLSHLIRMGHKRICFIMRDWSIARKRMEISYRGLLQLLREHNVDCDPQLVITLPQIDTDFSGKLHKLFFSADPPTAVYAYSDFFALECCRLFKKWNVRIPEQAAVMGFSGYTGVALQDPPLSTVDFGYSRIGRMAVDMLWQKDKWYGKSCPVIFSPFDVITRKSTDFYRMDFNSSNNNNA